MDAKDPDERQRLINASQPQDDEPAAITHLQAMRCAAIIDALAQGYTGYTSAARTVVGFLQAAAIEGAPTGRVSAGPSAAELWATVDDYPWPAPGAPTPPTRQVRPEDPAALHTPAHEPVGEHSGETIDCMYVACIFTPTWHVHRVGLQPLLDARVTSLRSWPWGPRPWRGTFAHSRVRVIISTLVAPVGYRCHEVKRFRPSRRGGCPCSPPHV